MAVPPPCRSLQPAVCILLSCSSCFVLTWGRPLPPLPPPAGAPPAKSAITNATHHPQYRCQPLGRQRLPLSGSGRLEAGEDAAHGPGRRHRLAKAAVCLGRDRAGKGKFLVPGTLHSSWAKFDKIVELAEKSRAADHRPRRPAAGLGAARTARSARGPVENYGDYGDFIYTFVKHYPGPHSLHPDLE